MIDSIVQYLLGYASLAALVGTNVSPFIRIKKGNAVTYHQIDDNEDINLDLSPDIHRSDYQFDCWAKEYNTVKNIEKELTAALRHYQNIDFQFVIARSPQDSYDEKTKVFRVILQVSLTRR